MKKLITMNLVLNWIKERNPAEELTSDNRLALFLGVSRQRLSTWRSTDDYHIPREPLRLLDDKLPGLKIQAVS